MAIMIHHGPNGACKSFGVVQRFLVPALQEGRTVVTNIRGFDDIELIEEELDIEIPEGAQLINVECDTAKGRDRIGKWFHWVPRDALICIDEAQSIYPGKRRDFKLDSYDYPSAVVDFYLLDGTPDPIHMTGPQHAEWSERPHDLLVAFEMHRHFKWDIILISPNVDKIHREIRTGSEWAYRHRNLSGVLPWTKNKWQEIQHDPENSGKSVSYFVGSPVRYEKDLRVHKIYQSTKDGDYRESNAGRSIFKDPKMLSVMGIFALCWLTFFALAGYKITSSDDSEEQLQANEADSVEHVLPAETSVSMGSQGDSLTSADPHLVNASYTSNNKIGRQLDAVNISGDVPTLGAYVSISGRFGRSYILRVVDEAGTWFVTTDKLHKMGYHVEMVSTCAGIISFGQFHQRIFCGSYRPEETDRRKEEEAKLQKAGPSSRIARDYIVQADYDKGLDKPEPKAVYIGWNKKTM